MVRLAYPAIKEQRTFCIDMPNGINFALDYPFCCIILTCLYLPGKLTNVSLPGLLCFFWSLQHVVPWIRYTVKPRHGLALAKEMFTLGMKQPSVLHCSLSLVAPSPVLAFKWLCNASSCLDRLSAALLGLLTKGVVSQGWIGCPSQGPTGALPRWQASTSPVTSLCRCSIFYTKHYRVWWPAAHLLHGCTAGLTYSQMHAVKL